MFHGTSEHNHQNIIQNGFDINYSLDGRWGKGIYFTDSMEQAVLWGKLIIKAMVTEKPLVLDYSQVSKLFPFLSVGDEEGTRELKTYVQDKGYQSVTVVYDDGEKETVVYDTSVIHLQ